MADANAAGRLPGTDDVPEALGRQPCLLRTPSQQIFSTLHLCTGECHVLLEPSAMHLGNSRFAEPRSSFRTALELAQASGERTIDAAALVELGRTLMHAGEMEESIRILVQGVAAAEKLGLKPVVRDAHEALSATFDAPVMLVRRCRTIDRFTQHTPFVIGAEAKVRLQPTKAIAAVERTRRESEGHR